MTHRDDKIKAINHLLTFDVTIDYLNFLISYFNNDGDAEEFLGTLHKHHIVSALERFYSGSISGFSLTSWANIVIGQDYLAFDPDCEEIMDRISNSYFLGKTLEETMKV